MPPKKTVEPQTSPKTLPKRPEREKRKKIDEEEEKKNKKII